MTSLQPRPLPESTCHEVARGSGVVRARDFAGSDPAFVLLHGFPDNSRIYDLLIPHLTAAGRRVVALDFLGFGASDKPDDAHYSFAEQVGDVEVTVTALGLGAVVVVGHDAGGPAAVNFAVKHPDRAVGVTLMNAFYGHAPDLRVPELIELFSTRSLSALHHHFLTSPAQFGWLVDFQRRQMQLDLTDEQRSLYDGFLGPIINENFAQRPSAAGAFMEMTAQLSDELAANTARVVDLRRCGTPFRLIWGRSDPYLHVSAAAYLQSQARTASLHVLDAGHWPQIDEAAEVASLMLAP